MQQRLLGRVNTTQPSCLMSVLPSHVCPLGIWLVTWLPFLLLLWLHFPVTRQLPFVAAKPGFDHYRNAVLSSRPKFGRSLSSDAVSACQSVSHVEPPPPPHTHTHRTYTQPPHHGHTCDTQNAHLSLNKERIAKSVNVYYTIFVSKKRKTRCAEWPHCGTSGLTVKGSELGVLCGSFVGVVTPCYSF